MRLFLLMLLAVAGFSLSAREGVPEEERPGAGGFSKTEGFVWNGETVRCTAERLPDASTHFRTDIRFPLSVSRFRGRLAELAGEFRWVAGASAAGRRQGLVQLVVRKKNGSEEYFSAFVRPENSEWRKFVFPAVIDSQAERVFLVVGFQKSSGCFEVRNLNGPPAMERAAGAIRGPLRMDGSSFPVSPEKAGLPAFRFS